jgi:hypothetical protein
VADLALGNSNTRSKLLWRLQPVVRFAPNQVDHRCAACPTAVEYGLKSAATAESCSASQPVDSGRIDVVRPGYIRLRLAIGKPLKRLLPLVRRQFARPAELDATPSHFEF